MIGKLDYLQETPSQTAGPYVHIGLIPHQAGFDIFEKPFSNVIAGRNTPGERIRIEGRVLDGLGAPCRDVLVEVWQANAAGRYNHPADQQTDKALDAGFRGWGRTGTDFDTGLYSSKRSSPARSSGDAATSRWPRTSTSGWSRAASISGCPRGCISRTRPR